MHVIMRAAGGPRRGFGHLVRSAWLARALEVEPVLSVRGGRQAIRVARRLGHRVIEGSATAVLAREAPDLVVIDDPNGSAANQWCRAARRCRTPVASVHDLGLARCESDLRIDGSIESFETAGDGRALAGLRYAVLDPNLKALRRRPRPVAGAQTRPRVLIALGGGLHAGTAWRLGRRIARRRPDVDVRVAGGFVAEPPQRAEPNLRWLPPVDGLGRELAAATVVLAAGGVTLYEACCLGVPSVALAVVPAQRPTIRAFAGRGAVIDGGTTSRPEPAVRGVLRLLADQEERRMLGLCARAQVDGLGAMRVASALRSLARKR